MLRNTALLVCLLVLFLTGCNGGSGGKKDISPEDSKETFLGRKTTPELGEELKAALLRYPDWKDLISKTVGEVWVMDNGTVFIGRWVIHPEDDTLKYCQGPRKITHTYIATVKYLENADKYVVENIEVVEYQLEDWKGK